MAKKLTPSQREELRNNMQVLLDDGKDENTVSQYRDKFIEKYGVEEEAPALKKKDTIPASDAIPTPEQTLPSGPSALPGTGKPTPPKPAEPEAKPITDWWKGAIKLAGKNIELQAEKDAEQAESYDKIEVAKEAFDAYKNTPLVPKAMKDKFSDDQIKSVINRRLGLEFNPSEKLPTPVKNEILFDLTKKQRDEKLKDLSLDELAEIDVDGNVLGGTDYAQSRTGKVNDYIAKIKAGNVIAKEDAKYLQDNAPKAWEQLVQEASTTQPIDEPIGAMAAHFSAAKTINRVAENQNRNLQSLEFAKRIGFDLTKYNDNAYLNALSGKLEETLKTNLDQLEKKYPQQYSSTGGGGSIMGTVSYSSPDQRPKEYYEEKDQIEGQIQSIKSNIATASTALYLKDNPKALPIEIGEHFLSIADEDAFLLYTRGNKKDNKTKGQIAKIGYDFIYGTGDKNAISNVKNDEARHIDNYQDEKIEEISHRLGAEIYKDQGGLTLYAPRPTLAKLDKIVDTQFSKEDRDFYYKYYRQREINRIFGIEMHLISQVPQSGFFNKFGQEFVGAVLETAKGVQDLFGVRGTEEQALEASQGIPIENQKVGEWQPGMQRLEELKSKKSLTYDEIREKENLENFVGVVSDFDQVVDMMGGTSGQIAEMAFGGKGLGQIGRVLKAGRTAKGIERSEKIASGLLSYGMSYDGARRSLLQLKPDATEGELSLVGNLMGAANMFSEHMFRDAKFPEAFQREVTPLAQRVFSNLTPGQISRMSQVESQTIIKNFLTETLPKFAVEFGKNHRQEVTEEMAVQAVQSVVDGIARPDKFNLADEFEKQWATATEMAIGGSLMAGLGAFRDVRANKISIPLMNRLGYDQKLRTDVTNLINSQLAEGKLTQEEANARISVVNAVQEIHNTTLKTANEIRPLTKRENQKVANLTLQEKMANKELQEGVPNDLLSKHIEDLNNQRNQIFNKEVIVDDNYNLISVEDWNKQNDKISKLRAGIANQNPKSDENTQTPNSEASANVGQSNVPQQPQANTENNTPLEINEDDKALMEELGIKTEVQKTARDYQAEMADKLASARKDAEKATADRIAMEAATKRAQELRKNIKIGDEDKPIPATDETPEFDNLADFNEWQNEMQSKGMEVAKEKEKEAKAEREALAKKALELRQKLFEGNPATPNEVSPEEQALLDELGIKPTAPAPAKEIKEPKSYAEAVDDYKATELGSSDDAKAKKQKVVDEATTPDGKAFVEHKVAQMEKNEDGTITVYRSGTMQDGHNPATTDKRTAEIIASERKKQGLSSDIVEVKVNPSDISAIIPGIESEVFVKVDSGNKERIEKNTTSKQKSKEELISERNELQNELDEIKEANIRINKAFNDGTFPFSEGVFKDSDKKHKAKIKNLEWQLSKIEQSLKAETPKAEAGSVGVGGDVESTTNVFNETQKSNPTVWQKIKDAFYHVVGKVHEGFKNTQDFIDNAINGDTQFSELAKALKDKLGDIKTSFVDDLRNKEGKLAYGKHNKDGITVSRKSPHPLQTWFHEAVHKLTVDKLYDYEEGNLHKLSDKDIEAIQNLHRIFGNVQKILNDKGIETKQHNPFKNVREFVAEALTNPEFQEILNKFKGEGKSPTLLKQFLDAVSKLLGLKDGSILDDVFHHTENLFNEGKSEQKNIAEAYHDAKSKGIENDFTKAVEQSLKAIDDAEQNIYDTIKKRKEYYESEIIDEGAEITSIETQGQDAITEGNPKKADEVIQKIDEILSGDPDQIARDKGEKVVDGRTVKRQNKIQAAIGKAVTLLFSKSDRQEGYYAIVEADQMQPSHKSGIKNELHFIPEAQPRDRGGMAVLKNEAKKKSDTLDPSQLADNNIAYFGAPIVNERGEVIQGNGRAEAIDYYYSDNKSDSKGYRKMIEQKAKELGIDAEAVAKMKNPVLVRMVNVDDGRAIILGNYGSSDLEDVKQGGADVKAAMGKLSPAKIKEFSNVISSKIDENSTLKSIIRDNAKVIIDKLMDLGALRGDEREKYFNKDKTPTPEGIDAAYNLVRQLLFDGGGADIQSKFDNLPFAQREAIEKTIPAILSNDFLRQKIQSVIGIIYDYQESGIKGFDLWAKQIDIFGGQKPNSEKYDAADLALAKEISGYSKQKDIATRIVEIAKKMNGDPGDMFAEKVEGISFEEAVTGQKPKPQSQEDKVEDVKDDEERRLLENFKNKLKGKFGDSAGFAFDPEEEAKKDLELLTAGMQLMNHYIKKGIKSFEEIANRIIDALGEASDDVISTLKEIYAGASVKNADLDSIDKIREYKYIPKSAPFDIDRKIKQVKEEGKPLSEFKVGDRVFWASDSDNRYKQYVEGTVVMDKGEYAIKRFSENPISKDYKVAKFESKTKVVLKPEGEAVYVGEESIWNQPREIESQINTHEQQIAEFGVAPKDVSTISALTQVFSNLYENMGLGKAADYFKSLTIGRGIENESALDGIEKIAEVVDQALEEPKPISDEELVEVLVQRAKDDFPNVPKAFWAPYKNLLATELVPNIPQGSIHRHLLVRMSQFQVNTPETQAMHDVIELASRMMDAKEEDSDDMFIQKEDKELGDHFLITAWGETAMVSLQEKGSFRNFGDKTDRELGRYFEMPLEFAAGVDKNAIFDAYVFFRDAYNFFSEKEEQEQEAFNDEQEIEEQEAPKPKEPKISSVTEQDNKKQPINKIEDLQDVGEKIGGAKKDLAQQLSFVTEDDIESMPLSKVFPRPDFKKLVEEGSLSIDGAVLLSYLYEKIPTKPRKSWKLAKWVQTVFAALETTRAVLENSQDIDFAQKILDDITLNDSIKKNYKIYSDTMLGLGFPAETVNLKGLVIKQFTDGYVKTSEGEKEFRDTYYSIVDDYRILGNYITMDDAIEGLRRILDIKKAQTKETKFDIYQDRNTKDYLIGKKGAINVVRVMEGFTSFKEAKDFLKENQSELQAIWEGMKAQNERRTENRGRIGNDWRNGENATSDMFASTFGFRGVEFGNWVNTSERQTSVNEAYDGLMDLASVLGVSPKALSLNGELGFAFGARGSGRASAHYEPGKVVINLTKTKGAGSLAHEWWHALDNYFSRNRGKANEYVTDNPKELLGWSKSDQEKNKLERSEMISAFKSVMDAIRNSKISERSKQLDKTRSKAYWSTPIEMSARSFESFIIDSLRKRGEQNDYLANFKELIEWTGGDINAEKNYPYPLASEAHAINEAYKQFFETIKEDDNARLYQIIGENGARNLENAEMILNDLNVAKQMQLAGKTPKEIHLATSWEKGADGKWRFEIMDVKHDLSRIERIGQWGEEYKISLEKLYPHPELYKIYPFLKGRNVFLTESISGGMWDGKNITIESFKGSNKRFNDILLHEIQHAIQDVEGFAQGGSPESAASMRMEEKHQQLLNTSPTYKKLWLQGQEIAYGFKNKEITKEKADEQVKLINKKLLSITRRKFGVEKSYDIYQRIAGEVEARNVEKRSSMSPEERKAKMLVETEDVARDQQIIILDAILWQGQNAQYRIENNQRIIEALQKFDGSPKAITALTHEFGHDAVVMILDGAKIGNVAALKHAHTIISEYNKANNGNITLDDLLRGNDNFKNGKLDTDYKKVQEFVARAWERYHFEGAKGFSAGFQKVLDAITDAFKQVYKAIVNSDIDVPLTPELKKMFDEILGKIETTENQPQEKPKDTPTPKAKRKVKEGKIKDELDGLLDDLMGPSDLMTSGGLDPKKIEKAVKAVGLYIKLGIYKFQDMIEDLYAKYGDAAERIFREMKTAYLDFRESEATDEQAQMMDSSLRNVSFDDFKYKADINDNPENNFVSAVQEKLQQKEKLNIISIRKLATEVGLGEQEDTKLQELVELAIIQEAKNIVAQDISEDEKFEQIKELYKTQPTISQRSSSRIENQQYSTPIPMSFVAGDYVNQITPLRILEPSAGNGMMVFNTKTENVIANEIDSVRLKNLQKQPFLMVTNQDGTKPFSISPVDAVITNPPFGPAPRKLYGDVYNIAGLDEQMAINALESMKDDGRAAIIIGGHNQYEENGSLKSQKAFLNYLYQYYNVADIINMDGSLYAKQGTTFPTRMILINGRRTGDMSTRRFAPYKENAQADVVKTFDELYNRIKSIKNDNIPFTESASDTDLGDVGVPDNADKRNTSGEGDKKTNPTSAGTRGGRNNPGGRSSGNNNPIEGDGTERTGSTDDGNMADEVAPTEDGGTPRNPIEGGFDIDLQREDPLQFPDGLEERDRKPDRSLDIHSEKTNYQPQSKGFSLKSVVPTNMAGALADVLAQFGDIDAYVQNKLAYKTKEDLFKALAAEQIDGVALAIYQIDKGLGLIIGDQTGLGKGRQAASIIRYAVINGYKPIFLTEGSHLFSDLYRDLKNIGSADLKPLIINQKDSINDPTIKDENGNVVHKPLSADQIRPILNSGKVPNKYDFVILTYSQLRSASVTAKKGFMSSIAQGNVLVMDESHNAGGTGNTNAYFLELLPTTKGVLFLSGTFAKTPENVPVYSSKTSMSDANMTTEELISAIRQGGVPLQEIMARNLVGVGQMLRRERDMEGVTIDWEVMEDQKEAHTAVFNKVIKIFNELIHFQRDFVNPVIEEMSQEASGEHGSAGTTRGTADIGISNTPFASKAFNLVRQLLLSLKADHVANTAIEELKNGRKPFITLSNTMGSFVDDMGVEVGEILSNTDFSLVLTKGLTGTMRYTVKDFANNRTHLYLQLADLSEEGRRKFAEIEEEIKKVSTGISISPIDVIIAKIKAAGYTIGELTGREYELVMNPDGTATVTKRKDRDKKKIAYNYNTGIFDVVIVNKSGSTGISLHASAEAAVTDKRQRVQISAQTELDVNTELQLRGRIDRTGQIARGAYRYLSSAIPQELRLLMMLKSKLKSSDANVQGAQESRLNKMEVVDFLNKYGDEVVVEYLKENTEINEKMLDPLKFEGDPEAYTVKGGESTKISGRAALLTTDEQEAFYKEVMERYTTLIKYLNDNNANDLEMKTLPLNAVTTGKMVIVQGSGNGNPFSEDSIMETVEIDVLRKPFKAEEIKNEIQKVTQGKTNQEYRAENIEMIEEYTKKLIQKESDRITQDYEEKHEKVINRWVAAAIADKTSVEDARTEAIAHLNEARDSIIARNAERRNSAKNTLVNMFKSFNLEKPYLVPTSVDISTLTTYSSGIFIGFKIGRNLTPSSITAVFATLDGRRKVEIPLSKHNYLNAIIAQSRFIDDVNIDNWDQKTSNSTRRKGHIITGNILQAYAVEKGGQLVSFTTKNGQIRQGILMPESYKVEGKKMRVQIIAGLSILENGGTLTDLTSAIRLEKEYNGYSISVPASKAKGGMYFLDQGLRDLVVNGNFNTRSGRMVANISNQRIANVLQYLSTKFNTSIELDGTNVSESGGVSEPFTNYGKPTRQISSDGQAFLAETSGNYPTLPDNYELGFIPNKDIVQPIGQYSDYARDLALGVKQGNKDAIQAMAEDMALKIPKDAIIVPMPSRSGIATNMLEVAREISRINGNEIADILIGVPRESIFEAKKEGKDITQIDLGLKIKGEIPKGLIYVIDNVVGTGKTIQAAREILPNAQMLVHSMDRKAVNTPIGMYHVIDKRTGKSAVDQQYNPIADINDDTAEKAIIRFNKWYTSKPKFVQITTGKANKPNKADLSIRAKWSKTGHFDFSGTTRVENAADVAHIMQLLESKTVEHGFAVHVDANGNSHIQYLSIGGQTGTVVDVRTILAGTVKFKSKKVYLVHNHPSSNPVPSQMDYKLTADIVKAFEPLNIEVQHLIMDTYNKTFTVIDSGDYDVYKREIKAEKTKLTTHVFDEFEVINKPGPNQVKTSFDVAQFIQQLRFTAMPKFAMLILSHNGTIIGNYVFSSKPTLKKITQVVSESGIGTRVVFYGNTNEHQDFVKNILAPELRQLQIEVADYIITGSNGAGVVGYYKSLRDEGILAETQEKYGTNSVNEPGEIDMTTVDYNQAYPKTHKLVFVDPSMLLDRLANDSPDFDVQNKKNQIGNRVQKAIDYIRNYAQDNRWISPKTGERSEFSKANFEPSIVEIGSNGKISFQDGRHRILAAKELGIKSIGIEVPNKQAQYFKEKFAVAGSVGVDATVEEDKSNYGIWQTSNEGRGDKNISSRNSIVTEAASKLKQGLISNEEYRATVTKPFNSYLPESLQLPKSKILYSYSGVQEEDESKTRLEKETKALKNAWAKLGSSGIVFDPIQNDKDLLEFIKALAQYVAAYGKENAGKILSEAKAFMARKLGLKDGAKLNQQMSAAVEDFTKALLQRFDTLTPAQVATIENFVTSGRDKEKLFAQLDKLQQSNQIEPRQVAQMKDLFNTIESRNEKEKEESESVLIPPSPEGAGEAKAPDAPRPLPEPTPLDSKDKSKEYKKWVREAMNFEPEYKEDTNVFQDSRITSENRGFLPNRGEREIFDLINTADKMMDFLFRGKRELGSHFVSALEEVLSSDKTPIYVKSGFITRLEEAVVNGRPIIDKAIVEYLMDRHKLGKKGSATTVAVALNLFRFVEGLETVDQERLMSIFGEAGKAIQLTNKQLDALVKEGFVDDLTSDQIQALKDNVRNLEAEVERIKKDRIATLKNNDAKTRAGLRSNAAKAKALIAMDGLSLADRINIIKNQLKNIQC